MRPGRKPLGHDMVWADPYSGAVRLTYCYAVLADGPQNIMPFLYRVHYSLALGAWGTLAFGIAALVWTIDCFVGFYPTFPVRRAARAGPPAHRTGSGWLRRWRKAWGVRWRGGRHRLTFDLHQASGLWLRLWPILFVFAWSGVGFNLPQVHRPVMRASGSVEFERTPLPKPVDDPAIGLPAAAARGAALMAGEARARGFTVEKPTGFGYYPAMGAYRYIARTSLDVVDEGGGTQLWFSGKDGRVIRFEPPGGDSAADGVMRWFYMLHVAQVFGLPYRIFVSALGLLIVGLSVTGVLIWMKKRSARLLGRRRRTGRAPARVSAPVIAGYELTP